MNIKDLYIHHTAIKSDINEHLPTLFKLARECDIITEFGTRDGCSTSALAAAIEGTNKKLICVDLYKSNGIDNILKQNNVSFYEADTLTFNLQLTDFFIHRYSTYIFSAFN